MKTDSVNAVNQLNPFHILLHQFYQSEKRVLQITSNYYNDEHFKQLFEIIFQYPYDFKIHFDTNMLLVLTK